jgi:hypothetical protein
MSSGLVRGPFSFKMQIGFGAAADNSAKLSVQRDCEKAAPREARSSKCSGPCFEAGRVFLPREAAWLVDYETVILGFPSAKYDDQVDSTVQFLKWAEERNAYATPMVMPIVITGPRPWD